jgi:hypothetical protein
MRGIRKLSWQTSGDYITSTLGTVQSTEAQAAFTTEFNNGDFFNWEVTQSYERLDDPFEVARGVTVPVGGYHFTNTRASYVFGTQRRVSGTLIAARGSFYDGSLTEATWRGRVELGPQLIAEPTLSFNHVDGPYGRGNTNLMSSRFTWTITPRMFTAALVQYQSRAQAMATNVRFRWEYQPGSELFVVYSDGRTTVGPGYPGLQNRSMVVKLTRLFRW